MKRTYQLMLLIAICLVSFASCKKKKDESAKAKLSGKWKLVKYGQDDNHNNVMDAGEIQDWDDSIAAFITFNGDMTGNNSVTYTGLTSTTTLKWSLLNNDADMKIEHTSGASSGDIFYTHIVSLSFSDVTFKDTATISGVLETSWTIMKKQ